MLEMHPAKAEELQEARALWQLSFGDSDECVQLTFSEILSWGKLLVLTQEEHVHALVSLLPCETRTPEGACWKTGYVYGLCVHPDHRKQGLATGLLHYADFYLESHGFTAAAVVPAEPWMARMYHLVGFGNCFRIGERLLSAGALPAPAPGSRAEPVSTAEYAMLRASLLQGTLHLSYPAPYLSFQEKLSALTGGGFYRLQAGGGVGCACADRQGDGSVYVRELLLPEAPEQGLAALAQVLPGDSYTLRTPDPAGTSLGLLRLYDRDTAFHWDWVNGTGYLGLPLD